MKTLYQELTTYEGDYADLLGKLHLLDIFSDVIKAFDVPTAKKVIRFLAYVYSKESDRIKLKEDWVKQKKACFVEAGLEGDEMMQRLVLLMPVGEDDTIPAMIKRTAMRYLTHQNDRNNKDLKSLYDLYDEMIVAAAQPVADLEQYQYKFKCRDYANQILAWIKEAEERIKNEDAQLKTAKKEIQDKNNRMAQAIRVENAV